MPAVLVPLAEGFEEIEAVSIIDVLRRAGVTVVTAGLDGTEVTGAHGIRIHCDKILNDIRSLDFDAVALPGGMPGSKNLLKNSRLREILLDLDRDGKTVAAICAAPTVLHAAGILKDRRITCYPSFEKTMDDVKYSMEPVVVDGNVITSRGPATAVEFALAIAGKLAGLPKAAEVRAAVLA